MKRILTNLSNFFRNKDNNPVKPQVVEVKKSAIVKGVIMGHYTAQSTLLKTYVNGAYSPRGMATIGIEMEYKILGEDKFQLWDVNTFLTRGGLAYCREADVVMLCVCSDEDIYSIDAHIRTARNTLEQLEQYEHMPVILVETKIDSSACGIIHKDILQLKQELEQNSNINFKGFFRVSAKRDDNSYLEQTSVSELFQKAFNYGKEFRDSVTKKLESTKEENFQIQNH